jgi:hypothetical protein
MATHRPLSVWVSRLVDDGTALGMINNGDKRADARHLELFDQGWQRYPATWNGTPVLALRSADDGRVAVELDDHGTPIVASPAAVGVIERVERTWPNVDEDLRALRGEQLPVRYWLLARLDAEGEPPDEVFALLPWELVDHAAAAISAALTPGSTIGDLVEMRHWFAPAVRGLTGPMEQLDHGLRTDAPEIARLGARTLLTNLRDVPLARIPEETRRRLATLVRLLGRAFDDDRELAEVVGRRLADATSATLPDVPAFLVALVMEASFAGPEDGGPEPAPARLEFQTPADAFLGVNVRGRVIRRPAELVVSLTRFDTGPHRVSVEIDEPGAEPVLLEPDGRTLRARLPWARTGLPARLIFRAVPA